MLKRILIAALWLPLAALAQSYPSPHLNNVIIDGTTTAAGAITGSSSITGTSIVGKGGAAPAASTSLSQVWTSGTPLFTMVDSSRTTNNRISDISWATGSISFRFINDAYGSAATWLQASGGQGSGVTGITSNSGSGVWAHTGAFSATSASFTNPLPSSSGGTGLATITAHGVVIGEGTGNVATVGPCATSGQTIISQGSSADPVCGYPTGALIGVQIFTSSGTYTPTSGTASVVVEVQAPGGGGGGVSATSSGQVAQAQSGSGGSYAKARVTSGFSGATITIGSTGAGGAAGTNAGTSGGTTSFGTIVSCPGGVGGAGSAAVSPPSMQSAASAPSACTVTGATTLVSTAGGVGQYSVATSATALIGAMGGASGMGTGSGLGNGSGGNGAAIAQSTSAAGGSNASSGKIIVFEYD